LVRTERTRPSPSNASSSSPPTKVTPCDSSCACNQPPASAPKVRERATSSIATIVQFAPFAVSEAATSAAI
jgi:hypothetical protein